jgi:subtilisin family serine protease
MTHCANHDINYDSQVFAVEPDTVVQFDEAFIAKKRRRGVRGLKGQTEYQTRQENFEHGGGKKLKRDGVFTTQTNALDELKVVSQAENVLVADTNGYKYDTQAGVGIWVYVIDTGANIQNTVCLCFPNCRGHANNLQEYTGSPGTKEWLFFPGPQPSYLNSQNDLNGHGSCVLSKVNGVKYGIAKNTNIVVAKVSRAEAAKNILISNLLKGYRDILTDIRSKGRKGKSVVNVSAVIPSTYFNTLPGSRLAFRLIVQDFLNNDVVFVAAAGNEGDSVSSYKIISLGVLVADYLLQPLHENVDGYPALFADVNPLIVVSSVDNAGSKSWFSQGGPLVSVYAPGEDITCASNVGDGSVQESGTSLGMYCT